MSSWVDWNAIWKIVVFGLIAGAGLPALFALGMLSLGRGPKAARATTAGGADSDDVLVGGSTLGMAGAAISFLIVLAAIGWGIYEIYQIGHPSK